MSLELIFWRILKRQKFFQQIIFFERLNADAHFEELLETRRVAVGTRE